MEIADTIKEEEIIMTIVATGNNGEYKQEVTQRGVLYFSELEEPYKLMASKIQKEVEEIHGPNKAAVITFGYDPFTRTKKLSSDIIDLS